MSGLTDNERFWRAHLDSASTDGVALTEYADKHGLKVQSLYSAKYRLRNREASRSTFVRVSQTRVEQTSVAQMPMTVRLPNGVSMSVAYDATTLGPLLTALASL